MAVPDDLGIGFGYFRFRLCRWHIFEGGDDVRLQRLPSLVLPAQRVFLTTFFLTTFFLAFFTTMSNPP
jgi:hypothetical protein